MKSIWDADTERPQFEELQQDIKTDVLVIGGGISGILCNYMIKSSGVDCVLVEADRICSGITMNTTAKITCQHGMIFDKMIKNFGEETAGLYLASQLEALEQYRSMSREIQCDFEEKTSYIYTLKNRDMAEKEARALERLGCEAKFTDKLPLPLSIKGAVGINKQAQFNPLKFLFAIAKKLPIFENTKVQELRPDGVITEKGKIKADKIIVATHFPLINKHGCYFLKMYQHRSYVMALENVPDFGGMYADEDKKGMSFRNYNGLALIGGGGHRTGKKGGCWNELSVFTEKNYPEAREKFRFATQDCITLDDIPYIGKYSKRTPSLYVVTGFNKWGMTSAMVGATILRDLVLGIDNKYAEVFSPSRSILRPQLAINTVESLMGLLTPTAPRCPHLGCALKYNPQEHSWDCSCHGSRFTEDGEVIDNPASGDMKRK